MNQNKNYYQYYDNNVKLNGIKTKNYNIDINLTKFDIFLKENNMVQN